MKTYNILLLNNNLLLISKLNIINNFLNIYTDKKLLILNLNTSDLLELKYENDGIFLLGLRISLSLFLYKGDYYIFVLLVESIINDIIIKLVLSYKNKTLQNYYIINNDNLSIELFIINSEHLSINLVVLSTT